MDKSRHLIVVSEDALVFEDLETLKTLPNFSRIWSKTARVSQVRSIYPTITYPCHSTMATGRYPNRHGIVNNEQPILCEKSSKWLHFASSVQGSWIFDWAKAQGLTTASVFWPVTGKHPSIDYLVAEYWPQDGESTEQCFIDSGSSPAVMDKVVRPNMFHVDGHHRQHPYCEEFVNGCACSLFRAFKPNLMLVHPANVDAYRHQTGLFSSRVTHGLHEVDNWLGDLLRAVEDVGLLDQTDFVITSDHGQLGIVRSVSPNVVLAEHGLIDVDERGEITDYRAFCKSAALSSHVYLKDRNDRAVWEETYALLRWMCDEGLYGISRVFTAEEADREEHLAGNFSFVLESDGFSSFTNEWVRPIVRSLDIGDYRFGRATHGHLPSKGPQPTLLAFGPHIREGVVLDEGRLVDQAPTFAKILGVPVPNDLDGVAIDAIVR